MGSFPTFPTSLSPEESDGELKIPSTLHQGATNFDLVRSSAIRSLLLEILYFFFEEKIRIYVKHGHTGVFLDVLVGTVVTAAFY